MSIIALAFFELGDQLSDLFRYGWSFGSWVLIPWKQIQLRIAAGGVLCRPWSLKFPFGGPKGSLIFN